MASEISSSNVVTQVTRKGLDMSSPFFLSNSENLETIMTSHVLTPMNYDLWSKSMMNALRAKNSRALLTGC